VTLAGLMPDVSRNHRHPVLKNKNAFTHKSVKIILLLAKQK